MTNISTQEKLLDAAERLIAENGYSGTSLRDITKAADANVAAVNYHFGSKEGLASAMLERLLQPLNRERLELLTAEMEESRKEKRQPNIERLLRAFMEPIFRAVSMREETEILLKIFSQIHSSSDYTIKQLFLNNMLPVFQSFFESFQEALPELSPQQVTTRMAFSIGAMAHGVHIFTDLKQVAATVGTQIPIISDADDLMQELIRFTQQGMERS